MTHHDRLSPLLLFMTLAAFLVARPQDVTGVDRVVLLPDASGSERVLTGTIEEIKGGTLMLRVGSSQRAIPVWDVVELDSQWNSDHLRARRLASRREWDDAAEAYREAYRTETRPWCKRMLLRETAEVTRELPDVPRSAQLALMLFTDDPESMHVAALPLKWDARSVPASIQQSAGVWLSDTKVPAAQLLGASWLLSSPQRSEAISTLKTLTENSTNRGIAQLAQAQLWRTTAASATVGELEMWQQFVARMHPSLRAGPYYLIAQVTARTAADPRDGAIAFLRIPALFPQQGALASESLLAAAKLLQSSGDPVQSQLLYDEIARLHADTPAAQETIMSAR